ALLRGPARAQPAMERARLDGARPDLGGAVRRPDGPEREANAGNPGRGLHSGPRRHVDRALCAGRALAVAAHRALRLVGDRDHCGLRRGVRPLYAPGTRARAGAAGRGDAMSAASWLTAVLVLAGCRVAEPPMTTMAPKSDLAAWTYRLYLQVIAWDSLILVL